ncbi:VOC family protein [Agromyces sp. NPDC058110]|uniref:VOC family protein n=1 Tax=Agromyces sp. NPDC058110 TaxID=3346345 RepID=UPI0036DA441E
MGDMGVGDVGDTGSASGRITAAAFHRAAGVAEWRVTATGPQAVFSATSLAQAAGLVAPIVAAAERFGVQPDIDVRPEAVVVRIPDRDFEGIPEAAPGFAADVSEAAAELGLVADPSRAQSIGVYIAQHSEADVRPFFLAALGYDPLGDTDAVDPLRCGPQLAFNPIAGDRPARGRSHFDVFVPADQAQARVDAALAAGGRLADGSRPPYWWSLASPDNHGVDIAPWPDTDE